MKKNIIKTLSLILIASMLMFALSVSNVLFKTHADVAGFYIVDGAEVRMANNDDDTTGIRFTAKLSESTFQQITKDEEKPVYFGIELSSNGVKNDICYLVDDTDKETDVNKKVEFNNGECKYAAAITYNTETLKRDLALDSRFNKNYDSAKSEEENIAAFDSEVLQDWLRKAYATEITARAYYKVGEDGSKVYGNGTTTRSMLGVSSYAYTLDSTTHAALAQKYFNVNENYYEGSANALIETGAVDYTFNSTDNVYINAVRVTVEDGKIPTAYFNGKNENDTLIINVVTSSGELKKITLNCISKYKTITAQAFYDSAADKIYYCDGEEDKTLNGSETNTFYYVDGENTYALADYSSETLASNVNYKYADSVKFNTTDYKQDSNTFGYLMEALQPKIKTETGEVVASIPYNPHTDTYTGVTLTIIKDEIEYKFTNAVIVSQMIDDAAELKSVFNNPDKKADAAISSYVLRTAYITEYGTITKGVYMLANDIDASDNFTFDNSAWNYFEGVLDGRGHNIYNLNVSGTETKPGNGLFSATSIYTAIQNVGFIDVKADYGAVFQGNMYDYASSVNTVQPTYYMSHDLNSANGSNGLGSVYYRKQLVDDSDTTTTIGELLKSGNRGAYYKWGQGGYFQNVFVKIDPTTKRLMGTISRNMTNSTNTVRAYNMVIEYLPENIYDTAEGANDGALPYNYNYTEGKYGVLFGGAYEYSLHSFNAEYDVVNTTEAYTFFTPDSNTPSGQAVSTGGALYFQYLEDYNGRRVNHSTKVYVISPIGLVSSAKGSILGTNETVSDERPYAFVSQTSYLWGTNSVYTRLERYDSYEAAAKTSANTELQLTSFKNDDGAEQNYWDISKYYLEWKNVAKN